MVEILTNLDQNIDDIRLVLGRLSKLESQLSEDRVFHDKILPDQIQRAVVQAGCRPDLHTKTLYSCVSGGALGRALSLIPNRLNEHRIAHAR